MIEVIKWRTAIDGCKYDEAVGIRIAKIAEGEGFSTFITEIAAHKGVNPHYHKYGNEHYHIISGSGEIRLKDVVSGEESTCAVSAGESFTVPENVSHQLTNTGSETLLLMFSCPVSHLESDRHFL